MSLSTRATRSRYSSPAHQTAPAAPLGVNSPLEVSKSSGNDASRSFMQRWLEPSVQTKTSFEEAGLVRFGVLEGMAPLGALPKAKKPDSGNGGTASGSATGVRRVILKTSSAGRDRNGAASNGSSTESNGDASTPAASSPSASGNAVAGTKRAASPGARQTASASSRRSLPAKGAPKKKDDDDDYNPGGGRRKKPARRSQAPTPKTQEKQDMEAREASNVWPGKQYE